MGEFILLTVQSKAEAEGVLAEGIVRQGNVGEQIISASKELEADYVVLGTPQGIHEADHFTQDRFNEFIQRIEEESNAEVFSID